MNYILVSISAYILNGIAVLTDKFLLTKKVPHPISYVFYISAISLIVLFALPFVSVVPSISAIILVSVSTLLWTAGAYFLFSALKIGLASRVAPIIGTLTPIFLIVYYSIFEKLISLNQLWGAVIATIGMLVIILNYIKSDKKEAKTNEKKELIFEIFSALLFATSYIILKEVYATTPFLSALVWSRFVLIPVGIIILIIPKLKKLVFASKQDNIKPFSKTGLIFFGGQISGGLSQFLLLFAMSLANPALVNSLQGTQYAFLFVASLALKKRIPKSFNENFSWKIIIQKIIGIFLIGFGLYIMTFAQSTVKKAELNVTFSPRYAEELGLSPRSTFEHIINDLRPAKIRLPVYWDEIQKTATSSLDFSRLDFYVRRAEEKGVKLTLAIGYKVPRYPECFIPEWAHNLSESDFDKSILKEIGVVVNRYKNSPALDMWQVENEPFFPFGQCSRPISTGRLKSEIHKVHELDKTHPVMITESGEFGFWSITPQETDVLGVSLYRRQLSPYISWFKSPLPPFFYEAKTNLFKFFHGQNKEVVVSELQTEPWANDPLLKTGVSYQLKVMPVSDIKDNIEFSKNAGFNSIYLWGVEWWYYIAEKGHPEYLNAAIQIFREEKEL